MNPALAGVLSAFITGLLLYFGNRYIARQTREVGCRSTAADR